MLRKGVGYIDNSVIFYLDKYEILPGDCGAIRLEIPREVFKGSFLTDPEEVIPPVVEEPAQPEEKPSETGRVSDPNKPMVALTYDDGPSPTATNAILDVLEKYNAVATFYDVGYRVAQYPDVVKREAALGCEVGSHSYDHKDFKKLSASQIQADVKQVNAAFAKAGVKPTSFRPPYGNTNATVQANVPLPIVTWSVDTLDWKTRNVDSIMKEVKGAGNLDGKVILMHGIYDTTAQATAKLVPMLQEQGYQLVTVSELIQYKHNETPKARNAFSVLRFFLFDFVQAFLMMALHAGECFLTDDMLHAAGIFQGCFFRNADAHERRGNDTVPFISRLCHFSACFRQRNLAAVCDSDIAFCPEFLHGIADAGLAESQFCGNINGTDIACFLLQNIYGFQVIFHGFSCFDHFLTPKLNLFLW